MIRCLLFASLLAAPFADVAAQGATVPQEGPTLSLAEAIRLARANNPVYRQTVNDRGPAAWGVRNAYAAFLPSASASGTMGYTGAGSQTFLATTFRQSSSTVSSFYNFGLSWSLSGAKLTEPGLKKAQRDAVEADITGQGQLLEAAVASDYLTVLEAQENARLAHTQVARSEEFRRLAQARFEVGQATLLDVRQAQVAKGQSDVALLRADQAVQVAVLRLFQTMGVEPPLDVARVALTDTFPIQEPAWTLDGLLAVAEQANPSLIALRKRTDAAEWGERAAKAQYLPTLSLSAGWSGFTQQFTDFEPLIAGARADAEANVLACNFQNDIIARLVDPMPPLDCSQFVFTPEREAALRAANDVFPFDFSRQPFSARLTISLPIFTGFERTLVVSEARARREDLELGTRARALEVRTEVAQRFLEVETAYRTTAIQDTNALAAAEQLQLATERYRVGSGTFFELLDAQVAAQQAEADSINAVYAYHRALAALEAAVGRSLR